jgi:hypothetical protein
MKLKAIHIFIHGHKFNAMQWRGPGLSPVMKLSWVQKLQKLLRSAYLLSVLAQVLLLVGRIKSKVWN